MIAQDVDRTRVFLTERRIREYGRRKKKPRAINRLARVRGFHAISGLGPPVIELTAEGPIFPGRHFPPGMSAPAAIPVGSGWRRTPTTRH
jgi:hypothetical protein